MDHEKALFDFDDEVNDLDVVQDRYPAYAEDNEEKMKEEFFK